MADITAVIAPTHTSKLMPGRSLELKFFIVKISSRAANTTRLTGKCTASGCSRPRRFQSQKLDSAVACGGDCAVSVLTQDVDRQTNARISRKAQACLLATRVLIFASIGSKININL